MRLIDAEELEKATCGRCKESKDGKWSIDCLWISCQWGDVMPVIQKLPTVEPQSAWIPCSEMLPKHTGDVLIFVDDCIYMAHLSTDKKEFAVGSYEMWWNVEEVTHWMPLPEPPKEVDEDEQAQ